MSTPNEFGLAGLIGMPVAHSRSPIIHNFWLKANGIRGTYVPLAVKPERLKEATGFLDEFFKMIDDPGAVKREFRRVCE